MVNDLGSNFLLLQWVITAVTKIQVTLTPSYFNHWNYKMYLMFWIFWFVLGQLFSVIPLKVQKRWVHKRANSHFAIDETIDRHLLHKLYKNSDVCLKSGYFRRCFSKRNSKQNCAFLCLWVCCCFICHICDTYINVCS